MELLQLKYFLVTAKYQHMTQAANSLHIAQPALSQSVKRLENELGVNLFVRSGRNIRLSDEGRLLQEKLAPLMKSLDEIPGMLTDSCDMSARTIRLNVLAASEIVTDVIIEYKRLNPTVNFQMTQNPADDDWDIRIATLMPSQPDASRHVVLCEEIYLAVPADSPFAVYDSISLSQVSGSDFIYYDRSSSFSVITEDYCEKCGFEPKKFFESDNPAIVRDLIGAGLGVAFWPAYSWGKQESSKVKLLHISNMDCTREIYVAEGKEKPSPILKDDFYNFISDYLSELH